MPYRLPPREIDVCDATRVLDAPAAVRSGAPERTAVSSLSRPPERWSDELDPVPRRDALDHLDVERGRRRQARTLRGAAGLAEEVLDSGRHRDRQDPRHSLAGRAEGVG